MKLCKDCKHLVLNTVWDSQAFQIKYGLCAKSGVHPVTGVPTTEAYKARRWIYPWESGCGPKGKWWEANEDLLQCKKLVPRRVLK